MKKILLIIILCFLSGAAVRAQFTTDTLGCVPLLASFKTPSDTMSGVLWDFGTGATSNKKEASHVFVNTGTFEVILSNHGQIVGTQKIVVVPKPNINIASDITRGCAPLTVNFSNQSIVSPQITVTGFLWDFGDGNGSSDENPINQYTEIGLFNLALTLETNIPQCNSVKTFQEYIIIDQKQNVGFTIDSISPTCTFPTFLTLSNTGTIDTSYSYLWNFGNGQTSTLPQPGNIEYFKDSTYTITLEVDNKQGCISKISKNVTISFFPKIKVTYKDTICGLLPVQFQNQTNASAFFWDFGNMADPVTSDNKNPEVRFFKDSTYLVKLRVVSQSGCVQDTTFSVTIKEKNAAFSINPEMICKLPAQIICEADIKSYSNYTWNGVSGSSTHIINLPAIERDTFYENQTDSLFITLEIADGDGCTGNFTYKTFIELPNALFSISDHEGVIPYNVRIFDDSESVCPIVKWIIDWGDDTTSEYDSITIKTANHTYYDAGKYYINMHIINEKGCEDKHYGAWVEAHEPILTPEPIECTGIGDLPVFCYRDTINIGVTSIPVQVDGVKYHLGRNISNCDQDFVYSGPIYNDPDVYFASATLENGGTFITVSSSIPILVQGPKAVLDYEILCNNDYKVTFNNKSKDADRIEWIIEGNIINKPDFTYSFPGKGDYPIILVAYNTQTGCAPDTAKAIIRLRDVKAKIQTDSLWCFNVKNDLLSRGSEDQVVGCGMGYIWSFPSVDKQNIITESDSIQTNLPPGNHTIVLEVRDVNGCRAYDTAYVKSFYIEANFISDRDELCHPVTALFSDQSLSDTTIVKYTWSLMPDVNIPNITHTFVNLPDTSVHVGLIITDALGCKSNISKTFKIYKPVSTLTVPEIFCEFGIVTFTATDFNEKNSYLNYEWSIDSILVSEMMSFSPKNMTPGQHFGTLKITEASTLCTNEYDFNFYVTKTPQAIISGLNDSVFCYPKTLQLSANTSVIDPKDKVAYNWFYSTGRTSNKINPVETFGKGEYNIRLRVRSLYGCESYDEKNIRLIGPEGEMMADKDKICIGDQITFSLQNPNDVNSFFWDFGQGEVNHNSSPVSNSYPFFPPDGSTFASLVLTGAENNCQIVKSLPITFHQVYASFLPDSICGNVIDIVNLSQGDDTAFWSWANQTSVSTDSTVRISVENPGSYPLTLAIENNQFSCKDTFTAVIRFLEQPVVNLPNRIVDCAKNTTTISVPPQYSYQVSPSHLANVNGDKMVIETSETINLVVKVTSSDGCGLQKTITISSIDGRDTTIDQSRYLCDGKNNIDLQVDSTKGSRILWEVPGYDVLEILSGNQNASPKLLKDYLGPLTAIVYNEIDCSERIYQFEIQDFDIEIPNVFSPNGDKNNDVFRPVMRNDPENEALIIQQLKIFNRWGKEVYNGNKPWDGKMNGQPVKAEVYYYTMTYSIGNHCLKTVTGDVTLLR